MFAAYLFNKVFPALSSFEIVKVDVQILAELGVRVLQIEQFLRIWAILTFLIELFVEAFFKLLIIPELKTYHEIARDLDVPVALGAL